MIIAPDSIAFMAVLQQAGGAGLTGMLLPMILVFGIFYLLIIRPQQKKQRQAQTEREQLLAGLKAGDKVVTNGGIYGTLIAVRESTVQLRIAQSVSIEVLRSAITGLQDAESAKEAEASK
jgi:preprotein translocase subunit YajC